MLFPNAQPNAAHKKLAQWEAEGRLSAVVTQNIDGLHQKAGSKTVYELHGSVLRNHCMRCGKFYDFDHIMHTSGVPQCECGGTIKPDVVLYEESLDNGVAIGPARPSRGRHAMIIGGTSLKVYPAAGLVDLYRGNRLGAGQSVQHAPGWTRQPGDPRAHRPGVRRFAMTGHA